MLADGVMLSTTSENLRPRANENSGSLGMLDTARVELELNLVLDNLPLALNLTLVESCLFAVENTRDCRIG